MAFIFEAFDEYRLLMLHGKEAPPHADWALYIDHLRRKDVTKLGPLVFTDGGAPNAAQRRALNDLLRGRYFARAIVNDSALVRNVIAAVSWFAPGVRAFQPAEWKQAAAHATFSEEMLGAAAVRLRKLNAHANGSVPWLESALDT